MPFNNESAQEAICFIENLYLTGDFHGRPFVLQGWQKEVINSVYGTVKENGLRQYKYAYLEIPKKNGKTQMTAAVALYHLVCDGPGGQIYCCAAEREQAALVYRAAKEMIEQSVALGNLLRVIDSKKEIHNRNTGTYLRVLSAEAYSKHGVNPTIVIFDELHCQPNRELWDYMTFGSGSTRKEPLFWTITTSGMDPDRKTIGYEVHSYAQEIINGTKIDPIWYAKIYSAPDDADIFDEKTWYIANPSLGVSIDIEVVREESISAKNSESAERLFRWLRLNQWISIKRIGWLPLTLWDETTKNRPIEELFGKRCYAGIDLSSKIDLTAIAYLFPPQEGLSEWRFFFNAWIPENNMKERDARDHIGYTKWYEKGYLMATPGDTVDYRVIKDSIEETDKLFNVEYYCGDPWHLEILRQLLGEDIQRKVIEIPQSMAGMSAGMGELERLFRAKEISHNENPLGRWCFGNIRIATDGNENTKPMKNKSIDRIDPIVALIDAASGAVKLEQKKSIYEYRGMRILGG